MIVRVRDERRRWARYTLAFLIVITWAAWGSSQTFAAMMVGTASPVAELNSASNFDGITHISSDGLSVVIQSQRADGVQHKLYTATRPDLYSPFSTPVAGPFSTLNPSAFNIANGVLSSDALELFYHHANTPASRPLFCSVRNDVNDVFPEGSELSTLSLGSSFSRPSFISDDHLRLYVYGDENLHLAERATRDDPFQFSAFDPFVNINSTSSEASAYLTPDELRVYFQSNRTGGVGGHDIWTAARTSIFEPFSAPVLVQGGANGTGNDGTPVVFGDTLFFTRDGKIFSATFESAAVPEPSSILLFGLGVLGLLPVVIRRRMKQEESAV